MSRLYEWWFARWYRRAEARAWRDPNWAGIQARRINADDPEAIVWFDHDRGLGHRESDIQERIWQRLNPAPAVQRLYWWSERHGPRAQWRAVRRFVQRGRRGWSDTDVDSLHHWLAEVIGGSVAELRATSHAMPDGLTEQEWDQVLASIAAGMDTWARSDGTTAALGDDGGVRRGSDIDEALRLLRRWWPNLWD